jgi:hypothetical protein
MGVRRLAYFGEREMHFEIAQGQRTLGKQNKIKSCSELNCASFGASPVGVGQRVPAVGRAVAQHRTFQREFIRYSLAGGFRYKYIKHWKLNCASFDAS